MNFGAWCYRCGEITALVAIYAAVGGPTIWNGGGMMAAAAVLMVAPVLYHGVGLIRRHVRRARGVHA